MPKRTKSKTRPKRKSRKGGEYGWRGWKTWKDNYKNCLKHPGMNDGSCRDTMSRFDYRSDGETKTPWATGNRKEVKYMFREKPGGFDIINPLVTVAEGDRFRVE